MTYDLLLFGRGTRRVVVGVAEGEAAAISARIETNNGDVITLAEVTLTALVQAYMDVFTHPTRQAIELRAELPDDDVDGEVVPSLVEVQADEDALRQELASRPPDPALVSSSPDAETSGTTAPSALPVGFGPSDGGSHPLDLDDGPVFGDVPTQHSHPAPVDPDLSVEDEQPQASDASSGDTPPE